jgi:CHASE3 domain sensor protein
MELFNIAAVFLLITSIILIIYTMEREQEFISHNTVIQKSSVQGAAYAINLQLQNKHHHVRLFLEEYTQLFSYLERYPDDEKTMDNINRRLQQRFADFFTFTITDQRGVPILSDFDSLVGDACQRDLNNFVSKLKRDKHSDDYNLRNEVFVHPQPYHYHYDIMAPLQTRYAGVQIFFSSFYLTEIADVLKTHEVPGQTLLLVRQTEPALIEVSKEGARDKLARDANLSEEERVRISVYVDIPDTDWRLVNLPDEGFESDYIHGLWKEVVIILIIVTFALITLVMVLVRISRKSNNQNDS